MPTIADKRKTFRALHQSGCFVIPNPWDVGSARYLQHLGFKALASTSAGFAFSQGRPDGAVTRDMKLAHLHELAHASDLPLNADFEAGYADDLAGVMESVRLAIDAGVSGLSIEDGADRKLYSIEDAVARVRAARAAIDRAGDDVLLVGRAECFLLGRPDLDETIARLKAYANAGADWLYAPGIKTREQITAIVTAVAPKPVNLLMSSGADPLTVADLAALGVRRISVGGALARVGWGAVMRVAKQIATEGRFDGLNDSASGAELNALFRDDLKKRLS
ncbi:MAG: isocitrate lyase/phosphoenolpyruvate mutase family protein [Rhizobiales bacterium]|nr:isocitrate lyase/phosphoenolpyruvate mutase family protein [Hyphomicrobiales bacterium]